MRSWPAEDLNKTSAQVTGDMKQKGEGFVEEER